MRREEALHELVELVQQLDHAKARSESARIKRNKLIKEIIGKGWMTQAELARLTGMTKQRLGQVVLYG